MSPQSAVARGRRAQRDAILSALAVGGWWTSMDLSEKLARPGLSSHTVAATLRRMVADGRAQRRPRDDMHKEYAAANDILPY